MSGGGGESPTKPPSEETLRRRAVQEVRELLDLSTGDDIRIFCYWFFWMAVAVILKRWLIG